MSACETRAVWCGPWVTVCAVRAGDANWCCWDRAGVARHWHGVTWEAARARVAEMDADRCVSRPEEMDDA